MDVVAVGDDAVADDPQRDRVERVGLGATVDGEAVIEPVGEPHIAASTEPAGISIGAARLANWPLGWRAPAI